ncbi:Rna-binding kh domain-containing protein rcf3 [Thalictrum thalictroides]|uniref:Rna-binding kh domain-containing protein rcf3 n=1 Tax=Thalictrum thalictroides TaxID=46969 RepID=A0A7J6VZY3_THATH|nr:Rna-binding kh domain-containing protein rcf3 [Thalictrum thalictroides]
MSFPFKPSKRPYDRSPLELNGKGKWQKTSGSNSQLQPLKISPGSTVFRVLCPISKSGSVIGKGGTIITSIRQETGAKVRVEEPLSGDDERVIVIVGSEKEVEVNNEKSKEDGKVDNALDEGNEVKEDEEKNGDMVSSPVVDSQSEKGMSTAQKALVLVFERMVEGEPEYDERDEESKKSTSFIVRLLVFYSQVGCVLGKAGSVIKQMAAETGAQIRILPRDKLPQCASASDELVQLTGGLEAVRKALQLVSRKLMENPPRDSLPPTKHSGPSSHPFALANPEAHQPSKYQFPAQTPFYSSGSRERADYHLRGPHSTPKYHDTIISSWKRPVPDVTFRLLCHAEKIGGVIGKGGTIVKKIHHETGCDINVLDGPLDSDERVIVISGPAHPDDRISVVQDAVLRVQDRIIRGVPDNNENIAICRLIVSCHHINFLLGKGGSIITAIRNFSGAYIRIVPKDQIPSCVSEIEEVVQITGEFESVQEALLQLTSKILHNTFCDTLPSMDHPAHPAFQDQVPPFPYMGRRERSPPGMYSGVGGLPPRGLIQPYDDQSAFVHNLHRQGIPHPGRLPTSAHWEPQVITDVVGPMGTIEYAGGAPQRRMGGFGGGSQPAIITSTTIEVIVPRAIVPSLYGEDGNTLKQIRQISGSKITITEPKPEATETVIIISGTPEQTHAAQSLLQAFVLSGGDSP